MCNHDITVSKAVYLFQSKKDGNDQETIQSRTTPDPGYQNTINTTKRTKRSALSQQVTTRQQRTDAKA